MSLLSLPAPLGYWPKLSWPWVASGNRAVYLTHLETGETFDLGVDGYPHGWLDATTLLATRMLADNANIRHLLRVTPPTTIDEETEDRVGFQQVSASDGHWAAWDTSNRVWYDGAILTENHHGIRQRGQWVAGRAVADAYALRTYRDGVFDRQIPKACDVYDWAILEGTVVYGYPRVMAAYPDGRQQDVTRSPWCEGSTGGSGFHLMYANGTRWLWSAAQIDAAGTWGVIGGPLGESEVIVVPVEASNLDVQVVGQNFIIAASSATGALQVVAVPVDSARVRLTLPAAPPASASFALDTTSGPVPLTVTARLSSANLTTWRWTLDSVIHQPVDGLTHGFEILMPGTHQIGLRTMPAVDVPVQTVTALPAPVVVVPPVTTPEAYWRMQTFDWINEEEASELERRQWKGVRVEGTNYDVVMAQCRAHGFRPLWILDREEHLTCPGNIDVCVGNENNDGCGDKWPRLTPKEYSDWVLEAWPVLRDKGCVVYAGEANNTSVSGLAWTKDVLSRLPFHPQLRGSIHRYPMNPKDQRPDVPQKGHPTIAAEDAAILDCFRGRQFGITEGGLMDVIQTKRWWEFWKKAVTQLAVNGHRWQAARFKRLGATMIVIYQLHSGGDDRYGVFVDGMWSATSALPLEAL